MQNTELSTSWIQEAGQEMGEQIESPLKDYSLLKIYNPMMGQKPDPDLAGKILVLTPEGYVPFEGTLDNVKVLAVTKCFNGYATRLGADGRPVKDEQGNTIKDFYFTPEVSVYDKGNIAIAKSTEQGPQILGKGDFQSYISFTTSMKIGDNINPLFDSIKTNKDGEKYPTSVMRPVTFLYFMIGEDKFKLKLGASYGNYRNPEDGTFVAVEAEARKDFQAHFPTTRYENFFSTLNGKIEKTDKYFYVSWSYQGITTENVMPYVKQCQSDIGEYNKFKFKGVDTTSPYETLPYDMNRLMLETSEKVDTIIDGDIESEKKETKSHPEKYGVEDLPF